MKKITKGCILEENDIRFFEEECENFSPMETILALDERWKKKNQWHESAMYKGKEKNRYRNEKDKISLLLFKKGLVIHQARTMTDRELLKIPGIGKKRLEKIRKWAKKRK